MNTSSEFQYSNSSFSTKDVRKNFVTKVFSIVGFQLTLTALLIIIIQNSLTISAISNILVLPFTIASLISVIVLTCSKETAKKVPTNYILLGVITVAEAMCLEIFLRQYQIEIIFTALLITGLSIILMTLIAANIKEDILSMKFFFYLLFAHLIFLFINLLIFRFDNLVISYLSAVVTCVYIVVDIQLIMGNKNNKISIDDYISASLMLYLDIIVLFKHLVEILDQHSKKDKKKKKN